MQRHHAAQAQRNSGQYSFRCYLSVFLSILCVSYSLRLPTTPVVFHCSLKETTSCGTDFPLAYGAGTYLSGSPSSVFPALCASMYVSAPCSNEVWQSQSYPDDDGVLFPVAYPPLRLPGIPTSNTPVRDAPLRD